MVVIIGAGPAGLNAGYELAKEGIYSKVLEEHKKVGEPVQCTGIVTKDINKQLKLDSDVVLNRLKYAEIHSPSGKSVKIRMNDLVVDRSILDRQLQQMAESAGCEVQTGVHVQGLKCVKDRYVIKSNKTRYLCDRVIGADGPSSIFRKMLNPRLKTRYILGKQATCKGKFDPDTFQVYLGKDYPGFFGWVVPESSNTARIGLGSSRNPNQAFKRFIKGFDCTIKTQTGGLIPIYDPRIRTSRKKMYLVGDSAGQIKASTGGGVVQGLIASKVLARCIAGDLDYDKMWRKKLHKELWLHLRIRKLLDRFSDEEYDDLVDDLSEKKVRTILSNTTRDKAIKLAMKLLVKKPSLLKYAIKAFKK